MTDDFGGKAVAMIKSDGVHPRSMPHPLSDRLFGQLT
jgi:hypothetical protein